MLALWALPWIILGLAIAGVLRQSWWNPMFVGSLLYLGMRVNRANFTTDMTILGALFGMPMFAYLLLRSKRAHANGSVPWKGRTYSDKGGLLATGL